MIEGKICLTSLRMLGPNCFLSSIRLSMSLWDRGGPPMIFKRSIMMECKICLTSLMTLGPICLIRISLPWDQ